MSIDTNTFTTFSAIGNREDLSDMIYRVDPTDTPYVTGVDTTTATAVKHEWQTQALAAAATNNFQLEGDTALNAADSLVVTVRLSNNAQISRKIPQVSGTQMAVQHAGRDDEMAYQEMLKGLELKRDIETYVVGTNNATAAGNSSTARQTASILSWIKTNANIGASGANPTAADGTHTRTDGTQRVFLESQLKDVLQQAWTSGGKPDVVMTGAFNKQVFSTFVGRGNPIDPAQSKKIHAAVDTYESDFGTLKVVPNRFQRSRDVLVLQMDMWAIAYLNGRKLVSIPLSITGDSVRKEILAEYALEARNEKASGIVADLTTS